MAQEEIELYSHILAGLKPLVQGRLDSSGLQLARRKLLEASARIIRNDACRGWGTGRLSRKLSSLQQDV